MVHPVGKTIPEVHKAYLAGFIDGDGAIMALLERHPAKRFGLYQAFESGSKQLSYVNKTWRGYVTNLVPARSALAAIAGNGWSRTSLMLNGSYERFVHLRVSKRSKSISLYRFWDAESTPLTISKR